MALLIAPLRFGLALLVAGSLTTACEKPLGIYLINRTDVPLAMGFSLPVDPCSERYVSFAEMKDASRFPAEGAWSPTVAYTTMDPNIKWIVVTDQGTELRSDPPAVGAPCGGQPPDWGP